ncbi:DUF397 domain-containing protein [Streptomyces sp. CT34]|uniref:DUF397 domain-containing protein n=1 Tax=Streptomyces sp. CT34 TaxID=1553907 RepID=UPI0005BDBA19|nr:DUF397 domain-containing protein [Streptomyces sp. CT34]
MRKQDLYRLDIHEAEWHRSSHSNPSGNCVEVTHFPQGGVALRDSKNPNHGDLRFTQDEWDAFLAGVRAGEF